MVRSERSVLFRGAAVVPCGPTGIALMWLLIGRLLVRVQPGERDRPPDLHVCAGQGAFFVSKHVLAKSDGQRSTWVRSAAGPGGLWSELAGLSRVVTTRS